VERFLDNFYKVSIELLFRPLLVDIPEHHELDRECQIKVRYISLTTSVGTKPLNPSREKGNLYLYLCDLLCSFSAQHSFRSFFFVLTSKISGRIASLLNVRDKHLCLGEQSKPHILSALLNKAASPDVAALRFFRTCLKINNPNLHRHLDKAEIFTPIVQLTVRESRRNNLLSSTCQEYFDTIRKVMF